MDTKIINVTLVDDSSQCCTLRYNIEEQIHYKSLEIQTNSAIISKTALGSTAREVTYLLWKILCSFDFERHLEGFFICALDFSCTIIQQSSNCILRLFCTGFNIQPWWLALDVRHTLSKHTQLKCKRTRRVSV